MGLDEAWGDAASAAVPIALALSIVATVIAAALRTLAGQHARGETLDPVAAWMAIALFGATCAGVTLFPAMVGA